MRTRYRIDSYQKTYFVIDSFEQLMEATAPDFTPISARLAQQDSIPAGTVLEGDKVLNRGTGAGWPTDADVSAKAPHQAWLSRASGRPPAQTLAWPQRPRACIRGCWRRGAR